MRVGRFRAIVCFYLAVLALGFSTLQAASPDPRWGRLANLDAPKVRVKATLFFSGQARDGTNPYGCSPASNMGLYTVHPADLRQLNWSSDPANRNLVMDEMRQAGINVIFMSSWGEAFLPCTSGWAPWAPMQTSPQSHDELFTAAAEKGLLIVPFIESRADWAFCNEFPTWTDGRVAPGTVSQIIELVNRYIGNSSHPEWAARWARLYDRSGMERYAVAVIHASSNRIGPGDHAAYAAGWDAVAQAVLAATGVKVGFLLDALPPDTLAPGTFKPSPEMTGPFLHEKSSVLGIACFIPEVWVGSSDDAVLIGWKRDFSRRWEQTGIPFLMDVSPGYDAHLVFPGSVRYGLKAAWTSALSGLVADFGRDGLVYNSWNGYTEAMTAISTLESGDTYADWIRNLHHIAADLDSDGDVDLEDFGRIQACLGGSGVAPQSGCGQADQDDDGDVDSSDVAAFARCLRGPFIAVEARCGY